MKIDLCFNLGQKTKSQIEEDLIIDTNVGKQGLSAWEQKQALGTEFGTLKA